MSPVTSCANAPQEEKEDGRAHTENVAQLYACEKILLPVAEGITILVLKFEQAVSVQPQFLTLCSLVPILKYKQSI
ncbi:Uncharacterized protein TCM_020518 [Theobroma cacao]|uniref:Uncharacterized protein n=1 Tax=Theobroma cacao TaxID=3641 RepID=A0A061ETB1_THECC|nr:Uncharacterized protein TCM_020518 [Theobroma cacao]